MAGAETMVVCEDDAVLRTVIRDAAEAQGCRVLAETDHALDAIDLARRFHPDAIVVDLALRVGTGMDVVTEVVNGGLSSALIVYTAFAHTMEGVPPGVTVVDKARPDRARQG